MSSSTNNPEEIPQAQKTRTIAHMNKDHALDLLHILQHYLLPSSSGPLTPQSSDSPPEIEMTDITHTHLKVTYPPNGTTYTIPFSPPLAAWSDRRSRLVEMTISARQALGIPSSDESHNPNTKIAIHKWLPPRLAPDLPVFLVCLGIYATYLSSFFYPMFDKGGLIDTYLSHSAIPSLLRSLNNIPLLHNLINLDGNGINISTIQSLTKVLFYLIAVPHVFEMLFFATAVLPKYSVTNPSVWWAWVVSVLLEGAPAQWRFKTLVAAEKTKHAKAN
ncbi:hypothetical protein QBC35DRAFT_122238 [Podospora australis]|uniref:DUF2470 domain-containing protein n=1 Tax=Podospora australis TaxID=1536484 RepID=A0AAN6WWS7_9PEZI|nr:hypothetical protein QBC35DRAFT_122238 [Podospora australis]